MINTFHSTYAINQVVCLDIQPPINATVKGVKFKEDEILYDLLVLDSNLLIKDVDSILILSDPITID